MASAKRRGNGGPFVAQSWEEAVSSWATTTPGGEHTTLQLHRCPDCDEAYHCSGVYGCEHRHCLKRRCQDAE